MWKVYAEQTDGRTTVVRLRTVRYDNSSLELEPSAQVSKNPKKIVHICELSSLQLQ